MDPELNGEMDNGSGNGSALDGRVDGDLAPDLCGKARSFKGTVVAVNADEVLVDIGYKCEGIVPIGEMTDPETGEVHGRRQRHRRCFRRAARRIGGTGASVARPRLEAQDLERRRRGLQGTGPRSTGRVLERVKGGLAVDIGIRAFLPGSLVDLRPNRRLEDYVDQEIEARVISFDRRRSNVVLSRKAVLEERGGQGQGRDHGRPRGGQARHRGGQEHHRLRRVCRSRRARRSASHHRHFLGPSRSPERVLQGRRRGRRRGSTLRSRA